MKQEFEDLVKVMWTEQIKNGEKIYKFRTTSYFIKKENNEFVAYFDGYPEIVDRSDSLLDLQTKITKQTYAGFIL